MYRFELELDTRVRCVTTTIKWHVEILDVHKKIVNQETKTRARRPAIRSGSKHLEFRVHYKS